MEYLYAPWRADYFGDCKEADCIFCHLSSSQDKDEQNRVFYRDDKVFCVMNKYPYTPGHFLIIPHIHTNSPATLESEIWLHLQTLGQKGVALLEEFGAQGVNYGINIKKAGGAGIPEHLHLHLIPRFIGDTNFFTTIGEGRVYGVDFDTVFHKIKTLAKNHFKSTS